MHIFVSSLPYVLVAIEIALFVLVMRVFDIADKRRLIALEAQGTADARDIVELTASYRIALYGLGCGFLLLMQVLFLIMRDSHREPLFYVFAVAFIAPLAVTLSMLKLRRS